MLEATTALRFVKGVGPRRAASMAELGVETVEDLLYRMPTRYDDRRSFRTLDELATGGGEGTVAVRVLQAKLIRTRRRNFTIFRAEVEDDGGRLPVIWFNQGYLARSIVPGRRILLYGRVGLGQGGRAQLENPDWEPLDDDETAAIHIGRIVPVYRKLGEMSPRLLRSLIHHVLGSLGPDALPPIVPDAVAARHEVMPRIEALRAVHFPPADADPQALARRGTRAQRSLAFEEIFVLQLALALRARTIDEERRGIRYEIPDLLRTRLARLLPFKLTEAQRRVLREIGDDLRSAHPMHRLVQGDVGSGKTIVALLTMLVAIENGYQAALMAPTEILAEQHARSIRELLDGSGIDCPSAVLVGSLRAAERRQALESLASGEVRLAIGTHALFERGVEFERLGLAVIDEQHRFGVMQRAALAGKGPRPDVLVMTATPIPRSLALTLYGDLDLSVIDELPPGRKPIRTVVREERERPQVLRALAEALRRRRQAYVVVPLVESSARIDLKAVEQAAAELAGALPEARIGIVHGRMKGSEKDAAMRAFSAGELDVLVATTVIEVGVDVPNASVMLVEHAERFGLSQLHQLRGRVGRGTTASYCVLMIGEGGAGGDAAERLRVMERTNDGFEIAKRDLELRGPGAIFGTQQHGLSDLQFLSVILDAPRLVELARAEARRLIAEGGAARARAERLLEELRGPWRRRLELARIG